MSRKKTLFFLITICVFLGGFKYNRTLKIFILNTTKDDIVLIKLPDGGTVLVNSATSKEMEKIYPLIQEVNLQKSPPISRFVAQIFGWGYDVDRLFLSRVQKRYISGLYSALDVLGFRWLYSSFARKSNYPKLDELIALAEEMYGVKYIPYYDSQRIDMSYGDLNVDVVFRVWAADTYISIPPGIISKVRRNIINSSATIFAISFGDFDILFDLKASNVIKNKFMKNFYFSKLDVLYTLGNQSITFINHLSPEHLVWAGRIKPNVERKLDELYGAGFIKAYSRNYKMIFIETDGEEFILRFE